jgi:serine protease Do
MRQRIARIKAATVRVWINRRLAGSGFIVGANGLIATSFHVVEALLPLPPDPQGQNQFRITYQTNIAVEIPGQGNIPAVIHPHCQQNPGFMTALANDYTLLQVQASNLPTLPLGSLADVEEGTDVYLCGHPLGIEQAVVARGMLSTKWSALGYRGQGSGRSAAWLDITQNRGNSGGPVMALDADPERDRVIGLVTYGLNPYADRAMNIAQFAGAFQGNAVLAGVDMRQFAVLTSEALATNSLGVTGCISAEYVAAAIAALR